MASAAGITLSNERNPMKATTYGVGEMIEDALSREDAEILSLESEEVQPMTAEWECFVH